MMLPFVRGGVLRRKTRLVEASLKIVAQCILVLVNIRYKTMLYAEKGNIVQNKKMNEVSGC